jgi:myo-inositol 2-dehydrogenase/D-chiro-inositol 1-dehydrogenase
MQFGISIGRLPEVRIALVGAGRIGHLHGQLLARQPGVDEVLVHDAMASVATRVANEIGGRATTTLDEALANADAVVIAAPTEVHAAIVRAAVEAGRPTFVEKPLAFDLAESESLVELIERTGARVQVGFQRRFDPAYREAARLVADGTIGRLYLIRLIAHDASPPPDDYIPTSGGLFRDSTIHDFDSVRFVTGLDVDEVYALGAVRVSDVFAGSDDVDTAGALLTLSDGSIAVLSQTRHNPRGYDVRMELVGSGDAVSIGVGPRTPSRSLEPGAPATLPGWDSFLTRFEPAYRAELEAFLPFVRGETDSPCTARDGLEAMRIAVAATRSTRERRAVRIEEITAEPAGSPVPTASSARKGGV